MPRCKKSSSARSTACTILARWLLTALSALTPATLAGDGRATPDPREVYGPAAPQWLRAVGKLQVPGGVFRDGNHHYVREDCSATLVTASPGRKADTIVTAWHCLANYRDLSRAILFTLPQGAQPREAYRLTDGGGMHADWALLRLRQPVAPAEAAALSIHTGRADRDNVISLAGYSRDSGKGGGGGQLTFDPACHITAQAAQVTDSDCLAHRGASGGAVVQLSAGGEALLSGVVSEGDGDGFSTFVPVDAFRSALRQYLGN